MRIYALCGIDTYIYSMCVSTSISLTVTFKT